MQFGFGAPVSGLLSGPRDLARIVSGGEAMGYDYFTISDHVMMPRDIDKKYPYTDTGELPRRAGGGRHEQLTCVAFVAAKTEKLRLVTSFTVVPHRPPVLTAKIIATIDVLSEVPVCLPHPGQNSVLQQRLP
jgi:alkanesulfonate monooxygenase SsuD/methylene tetrahydromethanopterin reductase-like flavin-dependent oxidoreductase (luciferase family)